jgi:hypothetical protein
VVAVLAKAPKWTRGGDLIGTFVRAQPKRFECMPYGQKTGSADVASRRLSMIIAQEPTQSLAGPPRWRSVARGNSRTLPFPGDSARRGNGRGSRSMPAATTARRKGSPLTGTPP